MWVVSVNGDQTESIIIILKSQYLLILLKKTLVCPTSLSRGAESMWILTSCMQRNDTAFALRLQPAPNTSVFNRIALLLLHWFYTLTDYSGSHLTQTQPGSGWVAGLNPVPIKKSLSRRWDSKCFDTEGRGENKDEELWGNRKAGMPPASSGQRGEDLPYTELSARSWGMEPKLSLIRVRNRAIKWLQWLFLQSGGTVRIQSP